MDDSGLSVEYAVPGDRQPAIMAPILPGHALADAAVVPGPVVASPNIDDFAQFGWTHGRLNVPTEGTDWQEFVSLWDDLVPDAYLGTTRCRRNRRYSRVLAHRDGTLERLLGSNFFQRKAVNRVFGGQTRFFEPLAGATYDSAPFIQILRETVADVNALAGPRDWELGVHFVRVTAVPDEGSEPAPEGRHSDGHTYVATVLVGRHQCTGGESRVYRQGEPAAEFVVTMKEPLEVVMLSDSTMEHAVSEIRTVNSSVQCRRDTMLIDFNAVADPTAVEGRTHRRLRGAGVR